MTIPFGDQRLPSRFWEKVTVNPATGCWEWNAVDRDGYPSWFQVSGSGPGRIRVRAHRHAFQTLVGPLGDLTLNHQCLTKRCVNPNDRHACEPMTAVDNVREAKARTTHCPAGHPYSTENTYRNRKGGRMCRTCGRTRSAVTNARRRALAAC